MIAPVADFLPTARAVTTRLAGRRLRFDAPGRPNGTAPVFPFTPG
jgi:hypothetical protein